MNPEIRGLLIAIVLTIAIVFGVYQIPDGQPARPASITIDSPVRCTP